MAASPTARTLKLLRDAGYSAAVVERFNAHAKVRQDLFGFVDVVAIRSDQAGVLGVQATTVSNQAARLTKMLVLPSLRTWLLAGNRVEIHGWKKRKGLWDVTRRVVRIEDLETVEKA